MEKLREIDRKLLTGVLLTIGFLVLWLLTFPGQDNILQNTLVQKDTAEENQQQIKDIDNFNTALIMDNNIFCERIADQNTQAECKKRVVRRAELEAQKEIPQYLIDDIDNFNKAIILNNSSFCNEISSADTKKQCLEDVK